VGAAGRHGEPRRGADLLLSLDRERDRNTIEGLYEPWLKTGDGIVCPSCLLPRERIFVDTQINGSVGALLAEEARREEWQLDEP
jgi:hypothetical protein